MNHRILIIGGGASGFFAAINLAKSLPKASIVLLEKTNQLLTKVKVSGGGRCNVTHAEFDPRVLVENYPRGKKELLGPFNYFAPGDVIAWFDERGIELKVEDDGRMFPISDSSQTIINCFLEEAKKHKVKIELSCEVVSIQKNKQFEVSCKNGKYFESDQLIIGIGGSSKIKHYSFLKNLGHNIISPIPSLFTFNLPKHPSNSLMGLSHLVSVKLVGTSLEEYGPLLFTHWGMSGPAILKLSSKAAQYLYQKNYQFQFEVCWIDGVNDLIAIKRKKQAASKIVKNKLEEMPQRLWEYLLQRAEIPRDINWADLNKNQQNSLEECLSKDLYSANGKTTFKEEFVSCGGVNLSDINLRRMESKKIKGLFFCGEVMNIDALTGGFNFQAAWTTAFLTSEAIIADAL